MCIFSNSNIDPITLSFCSRSKMVREPLGYFIPALNAILLNRYCDGLSTIRRGWKAMSSSPVSAHACLLKVAETCRTGGKAIYALDNLNFRPALLQGKSLLAAFLPCNNLRLIRPARSWSENSSSKRVRSEEGVGRIKRYFICGNKSVNALKSADLMFCPTGLEMMNDHLRCTIS